jgi:hypothetical protein
MMMDVWAINKMSQRPKTIDTGFGGYDLGGK